MNYIKYFTDDKKVKILLNSSKLLLDYKNSKDIYIFKRLVEKANKKGLWNGFVGLS